MEEHGLIRLAGTHYSVEDLRDLEFGHLSIPLQQIIDHTAKSSTHSPVYQLGFSSSFSSALPLDMGPSNSRASTSSSEDALGREDFDFLEELKFPSPEDRSWLDSLTPVSTPTSEEMPEQPWSSSMLRPTENCRTEIQAGVCQLPGTQIESPGKKSIGKRHHLPLSPRPLSPRTDSSTRSVEKRKKDFGTSIPFNFKATSKDEAMYDGYRWKKYGKKSVKDSPYPRLYFKCADQHCPARKQVQHSPLDPGLVFTTYEGVHNHDPPASWPIGVIVGPAPCVCTSSHVLPCLNCLSNNNQANSQQLP